MNELGLTFVDRQINPPEEKVEGNLSAGQLKEHFWSLPTEASPGLAQTHAVFCDFMDKIIKSYAEENPSRDLSKIFQRQLNNPGFELFDPTKISAYLNENDVSSVLTSTASILKKLNYLLIGSNIYKKLFNYDGTYNLQGPEQRILSTIFATLLMQKALYNAPQGLKIGLQELRLVAPYLIKDDIRKFPGKPFEQANAAIRGISHLDKLMFERISDICQTGARLTVDETKLVVDRIKSAREENRLPRDVIESLNIAAKLDSIRPRPATSPNLDQRRNPFKKTI